MRPLMITCGWLGEPIGRYLRQIQPKPAKPSSDDVRGHGMVQRSTQAIVLGTNALAGLIKLSCCVLHRGAGFMAKFSTAITYSACAAEPGSRPLAALFPSQFRQQVPDMACGWARSTFR